MPGRLWLARGLTPFTSGAAAAKAASDALAPQGTALAVACKLFPAISAADPGPGLPMKKGSRNARRRFRNPIINIISSDDGQSEAEAILIVLLRKGLHHIVYSLAHLGGSRYFHLAAKAAHPAVELGADAHRHIKVKICTVFLRHEQRRSAKAVAHGAFQVGGAAQGDPVLRRRRTC